MKRLTVFLLLLCLLIPAGERIAYSQTTDFNDVPLSHWAYEDINSMRTMDFLSGCENNQFGTGKSVTRTDFFTMLSKIMGYYIEAPAGTAETITRSEIVIAIVKALGYESLVAQASQTPSYFSDVTENVGYINLARDFKIISASSTGRFNPNSPAKREEAIVILMNLYRLKDSSSPYIHSFYAIKSADQMDFINFSNSVSFGWARLDFDESTGKVYVNNTKQNNNEYSKPAGYEAPLNKAYESSIPTQLLITAGETYINGEVISGYVVSRPQLRAEIISAIITELEEFSGVVIDFEYLKAQYREDFNTFLKELYAQLDMHHKTLITAVHPVRQNQAYYDGYDYRTIGNLSDYVIIMAHDYNAKKLTANEMAMGYTITPISPINEIYYTLQTISNQNLIDKNKVLLQISFDSCQWKLKDGEIINEYPYTPEYSLIYDRLKTDVTMNYSEAYQNPYISFTNTSDGTQNIIWYEDTRSVAAKMDLASFMGFKGISIWRLGNIPDLPDLPNKKLYLNIYEFLKK